ncbi:CHAT domain-containing protein [Aquimarina sp. AU119]|uniref:CHAT domain-containing protein n=1 Tax=Aquimarina sp. AU119 TaxID=2108528 RepID=UPI000D68FD1F|nr:CHAT domain-containing protein [Aquimarina sp. AU119]
MKRIEYVNSMRNSWKISFLLFLCYINLAIGQSSTIKQVKEFDSLYVKGVKFLYQDKDSLEYYLEKSFEIANKNDNLPHKLKVLFKLISNANYHFDLYGISRNLKRTDSIFKNDPLFECLEKKENYKIDLLFKKGVYNYKLKNYTSSQHQFKRLIHVADSLGSNKFSKKIFNANIYLASIYKNLGKHAIAREFYQKNLNNGSESANAGMKMYIAALYLNEKKYDKSIVFAKQALDFYVQKYEIEGEKRFKNTIISIQKILTKDYIAKRELDSALIILNQSSKFYIENDPFQRTSNQFYGDIYLQKKDFLKAKFFYDEYLFQTKKYYHHKKHQDIAEAYVNLGNLLFAKKLPHKALEHYQIALTQLAPEFQDKNFKSSPNIDYVLSKQVLIKVLFSKLKALKEVYLKEGEIEYLRQANTTSYKIIETLDQMKPEFENLLDKELLINNIYPAFHLMTEIAFDLHQITQKQDYINDAFYFSEKSKSIYLVEAIRKTNARNFGGVPDKIIQKEKIYQTQLNSLEKVVYKTRDSVSKKNSLSRLYRLRKTYYDFIKKIENEYPKYYKLKYNSKVVSLDEVKGEILKKNQGMMSYFLSQDDVYIISVSRDNSRFFRFPIDGSKKDNIQNWNKEIVSYNYNSQFNNEELSLPIFKDFVEKALPEETNSLLIIPDGIFQYIPFGALSKSNKQGDYLIFDFSISYANSVTLYKEQQQKQFKNTRKMAVFAPVFTGEESKGQLLYNTNEAHQISNYFRGEVFIDQEASLSTFKTTSSQYDILHLATHGFFDDVNPDYSYLAFSSKNIEDDENSKLYVKDLYVYDISTELVTLSACETGYGKIMKGEGMLSLARGFYYAGASSLTTTLWKVDDRTTSVLMKYYYEALDQGNAKDVAMAVAKRKYLENTEDEPMKHPFFWGGFKVSGAIHPIATKNRNRLLVIGVSFCVILLLFLRIRKSKFQNSKVV